VGAALSSPPPPALRATSPNVASLLGEETVASLPPSEWNERWGESGEAGRGVLRIPSTARARQTTSHHQVS
jgi:hypothetical protein